MNQGARYYMNVLLKRHALMYRNLIFYVLTLAVFGSLMWFVFNQGTKLEAEPTPIATVADSNEGINAAGHGIAGIFQASAIVVLSTNLSQNVGHPLSLLLLQIATIVVFSRLLAFLLTKIGQPRV